MSASGFVIHRLRFRADVTAPLRLPAAAGAALRGALFSALRRQFCLAAGGPQCGRPELAAACPVCFLLAPVEERNPRGRDVPRPYTLRAPSDAARSYEASESFEFGFSTFGRALSHFPYALLGVQEMGRQGLGVARAGAFRLAEVWAEDPLTGRQERIYRAGDPTVRAPALPIGWPQVRAEAAALAAAGGAQRLRLEFVSPTRLIADGRLVKPERFSAAILLARLLERLEALFQRYGGERLDVDPGVLLAHASARVRIVEQRIAWQELLRASSRHQRLVPMSGLVGTVELEGELEPLLPWLVWGTLTQVGKDAAMGNGCFRLQALR